MGLEHLQYAYGCLESCIGEVAGDDGLLYDEVLRMVKSKQTLLDLACCFGRDT